LTGSLAGSFAAHAARLGDLDGDGIEDGVALLAYRSPGAPPTLHLLAYRFDGRSFQPGARLALTGAAQAAIGAIADGVIEILVPAARPGDPACCPSGRRPMSFVLCDHELVRLQQDRSGTWADVRRPDPAL
jgi:hypothetical protein